MGLAGTRAGPASEFSYESLEKLTEACVDFYHGSVEKTDLSDAFERRRQLAKFVRKFHGEVGTLSSCVEEGIKNLEDGSCLLLMTAHQPNLFAYSGVLRKATLNHVLAQKLSQSLKVPVVSFFGIADQDFTDDRWVRTALLPDVERRGGVLQLRYDMPDKLMLNKIAKPSKKVLDNWRDEIKDWLSRKLNSIERCGRSLRIQTGGENRDLAVDFDGFWELIKEAYDRAENYADFNAFVMSRIVNGVWGYGTLFARFSECQQIFEHEFCSLLSRFDEYSRYVREATGNSGNPEGGVYQQESETIPFWYHCGCGSKARLTAEQKNGSCIGRGECISCGKMYRIDFQSEHEPQISGIVNGISARSLSLPLVFFHGLKVDCYVGGAGGKDYLKQASHVAKRLGMTFPPVIVWRPKDVYFGVGQLEALMTYRNISGTFDLSQCSRFEADLRGKIAEVQCRIDELEELKKQVQSDCEVRKEEQIQRLKDLSARQNEVRKQTDFSVLSVNLKLLENVAAVMSLHPCIVDYALNVGLRETSEQWITYLLENGSLSSNVNLRTVFDGALLLDKGLLGSINLCSFSK